MRSIVIVLLLAASVLAGCAGNAPPPAAPEPSFNDLGLQATSSTGVIRGIVVDDAIHPLASAAIALTGEGGVARNTTSTAAGTFGFDDLAPGTYFMKVRKAGYLDAQQSSDVVAGVADPPIAKVQLRVDAANLPYVEAYVFSGYIECMTPNVALCGLVNGLVSLAGGPENVTADHSQVTYQPSRVPSWVQTEMVWQSTQAAGGQMNVRYSYHNGCDDPTGLYCDFEAVGPSPLLLAANQTIIDQIGIGTVEPVYIRTFTAPIEGTGQCIPDAVPQVGGGCVGPAGLTVEQGFDYYTHIFYGYQPTEGWRFSSGEPTPQATTA